MVKKLFIMALLAFMSFTSINVKAIEGYSEINITNWGQPNNAIATSADFTYTSLWTFINFRQSYIEIDGVTVVSNGEAIPDASFKFQVSGGQHFELIYQDYIYRFALETPGVDYSDIGFFANYTIVITNVTSGDPVPNDIDLSLFLPNNDFIPEADASESFLALLTGYGINNPVGLLMLFFVVILVINIALIYLNVPSVVYIAVNLAVGSGFMVYNLIPVWAGFIFIATMILFLIVSMRRASYE